MKIRVLTAFAMISILSLPALAQTSDTVSNEQLSGEHGGINQQGRLSSLTCWQNGVMILEEKDILNFQPFSDGIFHGDLADGTKVIFKGVDNHSGVFCKIIEYDG